MKSSTVRHVQRIQQALQILPATVCFAVIDHALRHFCGDLEDEDTVRLTLGWRLCQGTTGHCEDHWPDNDQATDDDIDWVAPNPYPLQNALCAMPPSMFYHAVLPIFDSWPVLPFLPPSTASDGYAWIQALAAWLTHPLFTEDGQPQYSARAADFTPRLTTAALRQGMSFPLGDCDDAWALTAAGDPIPVVDHRPYWANARTPVGRCADAPLLVLYPERGAVDWPSLLPDRPLLSGQLVSGAPCWIIACAENCLPAVGTLLTLTALRSFTPSPSS